MLAIFRALAPELARGFSTSLALFANRQNCPDCGCAPVVHCAAFPKPADCVCQGSERYCPSIESQPDQIAYYAIFFLAGIIVGVVVCVAGAIYFGVAQVSKVEPPSDPVPHLSIAGDSTSSNSPAAIALQRLKENRR